MRLPQLRFTIRRLMIGIALLALLLAVGMWAWEWISEPIPLPHSVGGCPARS